MVRQQPLKDGAPVAGGGGHALLAGAGRSAPWRAAGLVALSGGAVFWLTGARYTTLGGRRALMLLADVFGVALNLPLPVGWALLGLTVLVGALVSLTEFGARPRRSFFSASLVSGLVLLLIWLLVIAADIASTYIGVTALTGADSWPLTRWLASTVWAAGTWSAFLTFVPELLIIGGIRWFWRGRF